MPQTEIDNLFQVERKKFFTSITGREYNPGRKPTKSEKLKHLPPRRTRQQKNIQKNHSHHNQLQLR